MTETLVEDPIRRPWRRWVLGAALAIGLWVQVAPIQWIGDVGVCAGSLGALRDLTSVPFDAEAGRAGDASTRGAMVADLAETQYLDAVPAREVTTLLGEPTCYLLQDGEPCYALTLNGEEHVLSIPAARSTSEWITRRATLSPDSPQPITPCGIL